MSDVHFTDEGIAKIGGAIKDFNIALRPGHVSKEPQVFAEIRGGKFISHNYGHGGLGYCLCFGTAVRSLENFIEITKNAPKDGEIINVGAGVIGLVTAILLHHNGYTNLKVITKDEDQSNIASNKAGALIFICHDEVARTEEAFKNFVRDFRETCF